MQLNVRPQIETVLEAMGQVQLKQAPFAVRWAINAVAADVAQATRNTIQQKFRGSPAGMAFLLRHVKVIGNSTMMARRLGAQNGDGQMRALVGVVPPAGKGETASWSRYRRSLLPMLEQGGPTPGPREFGGVTGLGRYWIPERRPSDRTPIPLRMFPINLKLQARRSIEGRLSPAVLRGKQRTFLIKRGEGRATIFQRYGRERDAITPLFHTQPTAQLPARRYFFPTAQRIVDTRLSMHLQRAMQHALFGRGTYRG
jgi:hypothetical protein